MSMMIWAELGDRLSTSISVPPGVVDLSVRRSSVNLQGGLRWA